MLLTINNFQSGAAAPMLTPCHSLPPGCDMLHANQLMQRADLANHVENVVMRGYR